MEELEQELRNEIQKQKDRLKEVLEQISETMGFFSNHKGSRCAFDELVHVKNILEQLEKKMREEWKIQARHEPSWQVFM